MGWAAVFHYYEFVVPYRNEIIAKKTERPVVAKKIAKKPRKPTLNKK
jgi:hypothetical protein